MPKEYMQDFRSLDVYQRLKKLRNSVLLEIVPRLPKEEKFDLATQMSRASKATCALLAEGFAKRFQKAHWHRYIIDVIGECNEMIDHLSVVQDVYTGCCNDHSINLAVGEYVIAIKQLTKLGSAWNSFHSGK